MKKFLSYNAYELAADPFFQQWIWNNDVTTDNLWKQWLKDHPDKTAEVCEAREMLMAFFCDQDNQYDLTVETELKKLHQNIQLQEAALNKKHRHFWRYGIAAAFILTILLPGLLLLINLPGRRYSTAFGETKNVKLPDGSKALLNGNTTIKFNNDWSTQSREVWITGKAFFQVKKVKSLNQYKKFIVHLRNASVEVLGTAFNVDSRKERTTVVLKEGSVNLINHQTEKQVVMIPGELVEISLKGSLIKKRVRTEIYTSWKDHELLFDQTTLGEISKMLEEDYGYEVEFNDASIKNRKFTGSSKTDEIKLLLIKIAKSNDLNIKTSGQKITINNP